MFFWVKFLVGVVTTSAGAVAPFKLFSNSYSDIKSSSYSKDSIAKEYFANSRREWFGLINRGCKVATEEKQLEGKIHNALFVCKEGNSKKANLFYYALKENKSVFENSFTSSVKEVEKVNYVGEKLELDLSGESEKITISLKGSNSWRYFRNVSPKESCYVITPMLGEERMSCQLIEGEKDIVINFEI